MGRGAVLGATLMVLALVSTGCGRTADRLTLAAYEPEERAAAPSTSGCLDAWNESAPAAIRRELLDGGFVDVQMSMWTAQAGGTDGSPTLPLMGCSWLSRRGAEYRSVSADWNGEGYLWPDDERSRGAGPWGDFQEQRFLRGYTLQSDGTLRPVRPEERTVADCLAGWNAAGDRQTYERLRRRPYTAAAVAVQADGGCSYRFSGRRLAPLVVASRWEAGWPVWDVTTVDDVEGHPNARVLGDTTLIAADAVPSLVEPILGPRLVVATRRVILTGLAGGCGDRRLETRRQTGRLVLPYVATRTLVTWRPEGGGRRRVVTSVAARHGELVVPLRRGTGVLRVETRAGGHDLVYVVCLTVTEPR